MSVEVNTKKSFKQYTGLVPVQVFAINPTLKELNDLGINIKNEPEYKTKDYNENPAIRIDFWVKNESLEFSDKVSILFSNALRYNQNGDKLQYINDKGKTAWADTEGNFSENMDWYEKDSDFKRPALIGEEQLTNFIRGWAHVASDKKCIVENPEKLFEGDYSELFDIKSAVDEAAAQTDLSFNVLFGINDKGYQQAYNKFFGNYNIKTWEKQLEGQEFKADYQNSLKLKEYTDNAAADKEPSTNEQKEENNGEESLF